jgi:hypothetical protein
MCEDLETGEKHSHSNGLYVQRRSFVSTVTAALSTLAIGTPFAAYALELDRSGLSYAEFLVLAKPLAESLIGDTSERGQDRYLLSLAALAVRLIEVPVPTMKDSGQGETAGTFIGFNSGGEPFNVLHWRLDPHARVRPHAHTYGNVLTLGQAGLALVENFELFGERDFATSETFEAVRTKAQILKPADVNLVSLERNYIHGLKAGPDGARGLDITTRIGLRQPTPYLMFEGSIQDAVAFTGRWSIDDPRTGT